MVTIQEQWTSPNCTPNAQVPAVFGQPRNATSITIHHWGDPAWGQTFSGVVTFLCDGNRPNPTSAHYVVESGQAACIVSPDDAAWHAGSPQGNATSIGIECNPLERDGDYQTVAEVIRFIRSIYGDLPLVPHNHWIQTDCPGTYDLARLDALARGAQPAPAPIQEGPLMALSDADQQFILDQVKYISSPAFKRDIFTGASEDEKAARRQFIADLFNFQIPWFGFNGQLATEGRTTTSLGLATGYFDTQAAANHIDQKALASDIADAILAKVLAK